jgi:hypothetical protein
VSDTNDSPSFPSTPKKTDQKERKMKKMILAVTMMIMVAIGVSAQREIGSLTIQPKFGYNGSGMTMDDDNLEVMRFGRITAGVDLEYRLSKWASFSVGAMYSQEGGKSKIKNLNVTETVYLDYIAIPLMANFYISKGLAVRIGLEQAFKVREKYDIPSHPGIDQKNLFEDAKSFNLRMPVGISYDFGGVTLDMRLVPALNKIMKNKDFKNAFLQATIGYKFKLK